MNCCKEYAQTISEYLDGQLCGSEREQLLEHLERCEGCRAYLGELAAMRDALAETPETTLPEGFHESVMEKVRGKKRAQKPLLWKRYAALAACAAIVFVGAVRLMPDFGAKSAAPEAAAGGADMAMQMERAAEEPAAAEEGHSYMYVLEDAAEEEKGEIEAQAEELALPTVRGENAYEILLSLGAQEALSTAWSLLVPVQVLENLPEGLELVGEFDASEELVLVAVEEVAA